MLRAMLLLRRVSLKKDPSCSPRYSGMMHYNKTKNIGYPERIFLEIASSSVLCQEQRSTWSLFGFSRPIAETGSCLAGATIGRSAEKSAALSSFGHSCQSRVLLPYNSTIFTPQAALKCYVYSTRRDDPNASVSLSYGACLSSFSPDQPVGRVLCYRQHGCHVWAA